LPSRGSQDYRGHVPHDPYQEKKKNQQLRIAQGSDFMFSIGCKEEIALQGQVRIGKTNEAVVNSRETSDEEEKGAI